MNRSIGDVTGDNLRQRCRMSPLPDIHNQADWGEHRHNRRYKTSKIPFLHTSSSDSRAIRFRMVSESRSNLPKAGDERDVSSRSFRNGSRRTGGPPAKAEGNRGMAWCVNIDRAKAGRVAGVGWEFQGGPDHGRFAGREGHRKVAGRRHRAVGFHAEQSHRLLAAIDDRHVRRGKCTAGPFAEIQHQRLGDDGSAAERGPADIGRTRR